MLSPRIYSFITVISSKIRQLRLSNARAIAAVHFWKLLRLLTCLSFSVMKVGLSVKIIGRVLTSCTRLSQNNFVQMAPPPNTHTHTHKHTRSVPEYMQCISYGTFSYVARYSLIYAAFWNLLFKKLCNPLSTCDIRNISNHSYRPYWALYVTIFTISHGTNYCCQK